MSQIFISYSHQDEKWKDRLPNIITLIAQGGEGKTSLTKHWLKQLQSENYQNLENLFGYSFYSQGAKEERQVSADLFFIEALNFFNDPTPHEGTSTEKAIRLLDYVLSSKNLIILDGLEPSQHPLFSQFQEDLTEAIEIAELGGMNLYLADAYLASCRLHLAQNQTEQAKSFLTQAKSLIEEMGYHRRDQEVEELEEQLNP